MAEFGTKATENAHAIRACKRVHVLSLYFFSNMDPRFLEYSLRFLLLVRADGRRRERKRERNFPIIRHRGDHYVVDQGRWSKGQRWKSIRSGRRNDKKIKRIEWHTVGMRGTCTYTCNLSTWRLLSDGKLDQLFLSLRLKQENADI